MPKYQLELSPTNIPNNGGEGSLDTSLLNGNSIQRTGYVTIINEDGSTKTLNLKDGANFDSTTQGFVNIPSVIILVSDDSAFAASTPTPTPTLTLTSTPTPTPTQTPADYTYTTSNDEITIAGYTGAGGAITIPSIIGGLPVVAIGYRSFFNQNGLTSATIPSSVTSIGNDAFLNCTSLTSVTIPSSVASIGNGAFGVCTGLTAITVDAGNLSYSSNAGVLYNKSQTTLIQCPGGLTSVMIPSSVTSIGAYAFYNCSLTSVTIPGGVTSIGDGAFAGCTGLTSVTIPDGVTSIGYGVFSNCTSLTSVTIPSSVTSIGESPFSGCVNLTSVSIPNSVTSIGTYAFYGCIGLTSVSIPDSVTSIGSSAFEDSGLTTVTIANGQLGIVSPAPDVAFFGRTVTTQLPL